MRLIDADAYKSEMKTRQDACEEWRDEAKAYGNEEQYARAEEALATFIEAKLTLDKMPTIEAEPFKTFAHWVASEVCNTGFEDMWSLGAFAEVACRKLYALGVVQKFRDEWVYLDKDELDGGENG